MNSKFSSLALIASLVLALQAGAGDHCCNHCGCTASCGKVCRLVCETKEVTKTVYECKCEDFCLPGPSSRCKQCTTDCCDGCTHKQFVWTPGSATIRTRKVLVKKEVKVQKPTYKWVVEDLCTRCQGNAVSVPYPAPTTAAVPPPPSGPYYYAPQPPAEPVQ